ncbi:MAG TPA: sulfocyanin-like copper-binding protein [Gaiellaceae bacterium]
MRVSRAIAVVPLTAAATLAAGCSSHHAAEAVPPPTAAARTSEAGRPDPRRFLAANAAARTVRLTMLGALGSSNNGFNFDGYGRGELLASVPRGWRVVVHFENRGSRRTSCAVVTGARSATLAFPGASVPDPVQGVRSGGKARFSFMATRAGSYRIASLVPGQAEARMFAVLLVTPSGRPSITARAGP